MRDQPGLSLAIFAVSESGYKNHWQDASIFCDPVSIFCEYRILCEYTMSQPRCQPLLDLVPSDQYQNLNEQG